VSLLAPEVRIPEELPDGWVPEDLVVLAFAERDHDGHWAVVLPEFTVVGVGNTLHEAVDEVSDMLFDYFRLSAVEGLSFEESYRPIRGRWAVEIMAKGALGSLMRRMHRQRRGRDGSKYRLRLPLHGAHC